MSALSEQSILVIDDDAHGRDLMAELLCELGFDVSCADCCAQAIRKLTERGYRAVIAESRLSDGPAEAVLHWLRAHGRDEPFIFMDPMADYDLLIEKVNEGAVDLLAKPVSLASLRRSLELAVGDVQPIA